MAPLPPKLGLIAGGGAIPALVRDACRAEGRPIFVAALNGFCNPSVVEQTDHDWFDLPQVGGLLKALHAAKVEEVCLCGRVTKPDFSALRPDWKGALLLPRILRAAAIGDDAILRVIVNVFEREGFRVVGVDQIMAGLLVRDVQYSRLAPSEAQRADIAAGFRAARDLGRADQGQAAVAANTTVVGFEDDSGTDALLGRMANSAAARGGVLVKCAKPQQERRVDLPTVGVTTVENAAAAGLAGIAVEAGAALMVDPAATSAAADRLGLFLVGFRHDD